MKRKYTISGMTFLFIGLLSFSGLAQEQFGTGTSSGESLPAESYSGYSYSQVIYLASEINASGNITTLQWYFQRSSLSNSNDWTIYIGHTTKTATHLLKSIRIGLYRQFQCYNILCEKITI